MKNSKYIIPFLFSISIGLLLISCEKEDLSLVNEGNTVENDANYTIEQIEKAQYCYDYISSNNKNVDYDKYETSASSDYIKLIKEKLEYNEPIKKTLLKALGEQSVGVLKNGSCGTYHELRIFMDNEDNRPASKSFGWTGSSYIDGDKNIWLKFCVVPDAFSNSSRGGFAVLNLGFKFKNTSSDKFEQQFIERYFDNEDNSNKNRYESTWDGDNLGVLWPNTMDRNTKLIFRYYDKGKYDHGFPDYGISYGVFGTLDGFSQKGYLYTDDEDSSNANWCRYKRIDVSGKVVQSSYISGVTGIIQAGSNTKLYTTKVR